jgi:hypothetical protein
LSKEEICLGTSVPTRRGGTDVVCTVIMARRATPVTASGTTVHCRCEEGKGMIWGRTLLLFQKKDYIMMIWDAIL